MERNLKPTIYDIAKSAGVSRQTVSRVINDRPEVAASTRKRVLRIIDEMGYRPSAIARSLSKQRSYTFGLVTAGLEFIGPSNTLSGIAKKADKLGYGLLLKELSSFNTNNVVPIIDWFISQRVDGVIWAAPEIGTNRDWVCEDMKGVTVPIIFLTTGKRDGISIVNIDNYYGARLATEHLLQQGRKWIGQISGPLDWWESQQRIKGWQDALKDAGIEPETRMIATGNWSTKSGEQAFKDLGKSFPEMDAVFAANDQMALGFLKTAFDNNIDIPNDISVIGFDNLSEAEYFSPPLSSISQDLDQLGSEAVKELARIVEDKNSGNESIEPVFKTIKPELVVRQSSLRNI